jgi:hypothetical protein
MTEQRPKNKPLNVYYVIFAKKYEHNPIGTVMTLVSPHSLEDHIRIHKLEHIILPCDGRVIDKALFPELYNLMENALPAGSEVRIPLMDNSTNEFFK